MITMMMKINNSTNLIVPANASIQTNITITYFFHIFNSLEGRYVLFIESPPSKTHTSCNPPYMIGIKGMNGRVHICQPFQFQTCILDLPVR